MKFRHSLFVRFLIMVLTLSPLVMPLGHAGTSVTFAQTKNFTNGGSACTAGVTGSYNLPAVTIGTDSFMVVSYAYGMFQNVAQPTLTVTDTFGDTWTVMFNDWKSAIGNKGLMMAMTLTTSTGSNTVTLHWSGIASNDCPAGVIILTTWRGVASDVGVKAVMQHTDTSAGPASSLSTSFTTLNPTWAIIGSVSVNSITATITPGQTVAVATITESFSTSESDQEYTSPANCSSNCPYSDSFSSAVGAVIGAIAVDPPAPATTSGNFNSGAEQASALIVLVLILTVIVPVYGLLTGQIPPQYAQQAIGFIIVIGIMLLIVLAVAASFPNGG